MCFYHGEKVGRSCFYPQLEKMNEVDLLGKLSGTLRRVEDKSRHWCPLPDRNTASLTPAWAENPCFLVRRSGDLQILFLPTSKNNNNKPLLKEQRVRVPHVHQTRYDRGSLDPEFSSLKSCLDRNNVASSPSFQRDGRQASINPGNLNCNIKLKLFKKHIDSCSCYLSEYIKVIQGHLNAYCFPLPKRRAKSEKSASALSS